MKRIPATEAKVKLSELLASVAADGLPIMIERHGKAIAALVAPED
ncbi:MAG: type II toxin-antitoxin system Phd/YefM family antitoxin, partial [Dehalococcoidia bacterium]|nr:type II toxin-antitoxin system Phd/YefM family antitoxin [Dehalococcoidia bacterium]